MGGTWPASILPISHPEAGINLLEVRNLVVSSLSCIFSSMLARWLTFERTHFFSELRIRHIIPLQINPVEAASIHFVKSMSRISNARIHLQSSNVKMFSSGLKIEEAWLWFSPDFLTSWFNRKQRCRDVCFIYVLYNIWMYFYFFFGRQI